jgi:hypothetical protein
MSIFLCSRRLFFNVFPFLVCKAQLIGDWYENRQGEPNTIIFLIIRQYYWRTDAPCANSNGGPNMKKKIIGAPCLVSCAYWPRGTSVRHYYWCTDLPCANSISAPKKYTLQVYSRPNWDRTFQCSLPIFIPIAY